MAGPFKWLGLAALGAAAAATGLALRGQASDRSTAAEITVYKSPSCGCCTKWVDHILAAGFEVKVIDVEDLEEVKALNGIPSNLASCHTAIVAGYVIEGHVPAADVQRLLEERPQVAGLAVPGMPMGSPGMEAPHPQPYDVLAYDRNGRVDTFARH